MLETRIEPSRMELAVRKMISRHEILRTTLINKGGEIVQHIQNDVDFNLAYWETDEHSAEQIICSFRQPFDFKAPPLFRLGLIKVKEDRFLLLFDAHHIITDGVSMELFMRELFTLYMGKSIPEPVFQYKDYVDWQQRCLQMDFIQNQKTFWQNHLQNANTDLHLPTDYPRGDHFYFEGGMTSLLIDSHLSIKLKDQVRNTGTTMYIFLLAAFSILLSKYSAQEDIVIGSPVTGRPIRELDRILGIFINMLAMRVQPKRELTFSTYLEQVKSHTLEAFDNQDYPIDELIDQFQSKRNRHPIFNTVFVFQNVQEETDHSQYLQPYEEIYNLSDYDLTLEATEKNGILQLRLEYSSNLFKKETADRLLEDFRSILETVSESMKTKIQDIELASFRVPISEQEHEEEITFDF